ncbi:MAG: D-alanyl-D-alanine carboxypeptidase family protein, partial [Pseudonocardiaceae bacterium]
MKVLATLLAAVITVSASLPALSQNRGKPASTAPGTQASSQSNSVPSSNVNARSFVLLDYQSGQIIAAQKADERVEPASLTKLMTAYLAFSAIQQKKIALTQTIPVSTRAWKAEGSRMFIEPNRPVSVDELLHGTIIQSGNDSSIALAEAVAGSEDLFAELMNKEAQRMGLKNTHFMNSTGLPDKEHYSTAEDMAHLAA